MNFLKRKSNDRMRADYKKRRSFLALLFSAGDAGRYVLNTLNQ